MAVGMPGDGCICQACLTLASFEMLPLVRAIIRPSATFLREEGLRFWLLTYAFLASAIGDGSFDFAQDDE